MRLVCPKCSTQYEVDDSAVPATGREVQCGSCSSTWFQAPARSNVKTRVEPGGLPTWAEEIVEDTSIPSDLEQMSGIGANIPDISSGPNEDIVSEPELEELIDKNFVTSGTVTEAAPETSPQSDSPAQSETNDAVEGEDEQGAAERLEQSKLAVAAALAGNLTGRSDAPAQSNVAENQEPASEAPAVVETAPETDPTDDLSTKIEEAIKKNAKSETEDWQSLAAQEKDEALKEQSQVEASLDAAKQEALALAQKEAAVNKAVEQAALEVAQKQDQDLAAELAAKQAAYADVAPEPEELAQEVAETMAVDAPEAVPLEPLSGEAAVIDEVIEEPLAPSQDDEDLDGEDIQIIPDTPERPQDLAASQTVSEAPKQVSQHYTTQTDETGDYNVSTDIAQAIQKLDEGTPLPDDKDAMRLSDYDVTDGEDNSTDTPEPPELTVVADQTAQDPETQPEPGEMKSFVKSALEASRSGTSLGQNREGESPTLHVIGEDGTSEQTETLAAKLKARVAEAARAQDNGNITTSGAVLTASAAGLAATGAAAATSFPKRQTEDLASSLRPKPEERTVIKPRLRPAATPEPTASRFGQGFGLAIALFAVLLLIYLFREQLSLAVPALEPSISAYANYVDALRMSVQGLLGRN